MSKITSFQESLGEIEKYCKIWAKMNGYPYSTISCVDINLDIISFFAMPCTSGIGSKFFFDANLIDRYPNLGDFEKYCVELFNIKEATRKTDEDRIKELELSIINSNDFKKLSDLARKNGKVASLKLEFDNTFVNFGVVGWPSNFVMDNPAGFLSRSGY